MSRETEESLPSLAHPLYIPPTQGGEKDKKGLFLPPFPEIDVNNWDGFCFSHLHWVGFNTFNDEGQLEDWQTKLVQLHEYTHEALTVFLFSRYMKYHTFILDVLIHNTFEEKQEEISVPLRHKLLRNDLEEQWGSIVDLLSESELVEEVDAVRSSLLNLLDLHLITNGERRDLETKYMNLYENEIPLFGKAYKTLDFVASKIGENAVKAIIRNVFATRSPNVAFWDILSVMVEFAPGLAANDFVEKPVSELFLWKLSAKKTNYISNLSLKQASNYLCKRIDKLDRDDLRYGKKWMRGMLVEMQHETVLQLFDKYVFGSYPNNIEVATYFPRNNDYIYVLFANREVYKQVDNRNFAIFLEAIRQQLTQGIGLLCPFWSYLRPRCCSSRNRELLEKVWSCTRPDSSCTLWERMGCLKENTSDIIPLRRPVNGLPKFGRAKSRASDHK